MYENEYSGVLFVDLCKAFDLVDYEILLRKLEIYHTGESSPKWFQSYLGVRKQVVQFNKKHSSEGATTHSAPQGSLLGPLLFLVYINDLPLYTTSVNAYMFADDTCTSVHGKDAKTVCDKLQQEAKNISTWCGENKMIINVDKTNCMLIASQKKLQHTSNQHLTVSIQGKQVTNVTDKYY